MSDIIFADDPKLKMRLIAWYAQRELTKQAKSYGIVIPEGKTVLDVVHDDLFNSPNPVIRKIHTNLIEAGSHMGTHYHKGIIIDLGSFLMWVCDKDTAYRDPAFWILNEILNDETIRKELPYYVNPPEKWYCPTWQKTKANTKKLQDENKIGQFDMAKDEDIFVPVKQQIKWQGIIKKEIEDEVKKANSEVK